jgi:syntaxin 7
MSFADLESGALQAPRRGRGPDATRALVFQITTAVSSYRRLLNSLGTPKDTLTLRDQLSVRDPSFLLYVFFFRVVFLRYVTRWLAHTDIVP